MELKNGLEVKLLQAQTGVTIMATSISNEKTISPVKFHGIKMTTSNLGVVIEFGGKTALVPYTNIINFEFDISDIKSTVIPMVKSSK